MPDDGAKGFQPIDRRQFVSMMGGVLCSSALPASAGTPFEVVTDWVADIGDAANWLAEERGYFAQQGLSVRIHASRGPQSPDALVLLAARRADLARGFWLGTLDAVARGNDFVIVGAMSPVNPSGLLSRPDKPLLKPADLVGSHILVQQNSFRTIFDTILKLHGLPLNYEVSLTGFMPDPLFARDGDGYLCFVTDQPIKLQRAGMIEGRDYILARLRDMGYTVAENLMVVRRDFLDTKRSQIVAYLRALLRGQKDFAADPRAAAKLTVEKYGADLGLDVLDQQAIGEAEIPLARLSDASGPFELSQSAIDAMYRIAVLSGRSPPSRQRMFDSSVLLEAMRSTLP